MLATATKGNVPFTGLSGFVNQLSVDATAQATSAAFLVTSTGCYASTPTIPLSGNIQQANLSLVSFENDGQVLTLNAATNVTGTTLSGTYSVAGGCGDGNTGTISGTRYAALNGTYQGTLANDPTKKLTLNLTQYVQGTGGGTFLITGSIAATGFSCFNTGSIPANGDGYVSGETAVLSFTTNDPGGAHLVLNGTFDVAASVLTVTSTQVTGGSCSGSYGSVSLTH